MNSSHTHKTRFCYLLGVTFKILAITAAVFFENVILGFLTCIDGWCTSLVSCPVHLVIFSLQPATEACVIKIATRVIAAVDFVRAIPAVIGKVTKLSPRDTLSGAVADRWAIQMSF